MAQISVLQIWCVIFLLLGVGCAGGSSSSSSAVLSDSESYFDECDWIDCPKKPETETETEECPADSVNIIIKEFAEIQLNDDTGAKHDLQSKCCNMPRCRCKECLKRPQCKADEVIIELNQGNGQPGSCCTEYKCGQKPQECGKTYWEDKCTKCISCKELCMDTCPYQADESSPNCLTDDGDIKFNNEKWTQGNGCVTCTCLDGFKDCYEPFCKPLECENPIKKADECCPICPSELEEMPSTTSSNTTTISSTSYTSTTVAPSTTAANSTTETAVVASSSTTLKFTREQMEQFTAILKKWSTISSSSTSGEDEESTMTTELPSVEEATEKPIEPEIPEIPEIPDIPEIETTEESLNESIEPELPEMVHYETVTRDSLETQSTEDMFSSTSAPATSTAVEKEEQTADNIEETTLTVVDNPEEDSSSNIFSTFSSSSSPAPTTEHPGHLATSSPAALTPESTSWHRDTIVTDKDYRLASASPNDAMHPSSLIQIILQNIYPIITVILVFIILVVGPVVFCYQRRKSMYSMGRKTMCNSVPHSECNVSETTHIFDLESCIEKPDVHNLAQKQLKESVE